MMRRVVLGIKVMTANMLETMIVARSVLLSRSLNQLEYTQGDSPTEVWGSEKRKGCICYSTKPRSFIGLIYPESWLDDY